MSARRSVLVDDRRRRRRHQRARRRASIASSINIVQRQLRVETSGGAYADLRAQFYQRLQAIYGAPGSDSALETVFNNFTARCRRWSTSPDSARRAAWC